MSEFDIESYFLFITSRVVISMGDIVALALQLEFEPISVT